MATRIRKVVTAYDTQGRAFSEQHTETEVNGKWYPNDPITLDSTSEWAGEFNAALESENKELQKKIVALESFETENRELRKKIVSLTFAETTTVV
jgi:hypothetical protein